MENEITEDGGVCENDIICPQSIIRLSDSSMVDLTMEVKRIIREKFLEWLMKTIKMITILVMFQNPQ